MTRGQGVLTLHFTGGGGRALGRSGPSELKAELSLEAGPSQFLPQDCLLGSRGGEVGGLCPLQSVGQT